MLAWAKLVISVLKSANKRIQKETDETKSSLTVAKKMIAKSNENYEQTLANLQKDLSISRSQREQIEIERDSLKLAVSKINRDLLDANNIIDSTMVHAERVQSSLRGKCRRLRAERDNAKNALSQAEEDKDMLGRICRRLQNERDEAQREIDEFCNGNLSSKSMEELDSTEKKIKLTLDRNVERKETLIQEKLTEEAEKQLCVICQSEPKSVLLM